MIGKPPDCHPDRKHYARGLCENCYQSVEAKGELGSYPRRLRKLDSSGVTCDHAGKPKGGHGLCTSCYNKFQRNQRPGCRRRSNLRMRGLTESQYDEMMVVQGGVCAICGKPETAKANPKHTHAKSLAIDHCHKTSAIRGLLCGACNNMLGNARDNDKTLEQAALYLKISRAIPSSQET